MYVLFKFHKPNSNGYCLKNIAPKIIISINFFYSGIEGL